MLYSIKGIIPSKLHTDLVTISKKSLLRRMPHAFCGAETILHVVQDCLLTK